MRDNGFLALGIALSTGIAPICITTSGSAPSHLFPAVAEAFNSNVGMIVISAGSTSRIAKCWCCANNQSG